MVSLEICAELPNPRYSRVPMDARSVAKAADVKQGTLNAWIARGLIPGVKVGASGKRRNIDFPTAVRIAVFAQLTRHGVAPDRASQIAADLPQNRTQSGWLFIPQQDWRDEWGGPGMACTHMMELAQLPDHLRTLHSLPEFFVMVDVGRLAERVRQAELEWEQSRRGNQADG